MALVQDGESKPRIFERVPILTAAIQFDGTEEGALAVLDWLKNVKKLGSYVKEVPLSNIYSGETFQVIDVELKSDLALRVVLDTYGSSEGTKNQTTRVRPSWWLFLNHKQELDMLSDREFKQLYKEKTDV